MSPISSIGVYSRRRRDRERRYATRLFAIGVYSDQYIAMERESANEFVQSIHSKLYNVVYKHSPNDVNAEPLKHWAAAHTIYIILDSGPMRHYASYVLNFSRVWFKHTKRQSLYVYIVYTGMLGLWTYSTVQRIDSCSWSIRTSNKTAPM